MAKLNQKLPPELERRIAGAESEAIPVPDPRYIYQVYTEDIAGLTPGDINIWLGAARNGINFWKAILYDEIKRRDLSIGDAVEKRTHNVLGKKWHIRSDWTEGKEYCEAMLKNLRVTDDTSGVNELMVAVVEGNITGLSTFQINYTTDSSKWYIDKISRIPNKRTLYYDNEDVYRYMDFNRTDVHQIRSITYSQFDRPDLSKFPTLDVPPQKLFEVHSFAGDQGNGLMNGCIDALVYAYMFKSYDIKDWAIYSEVFAMPIVIGKFDDLLGKNNRRKFLEALRAIRQKATVMIPKECEIDTLTDPAKGSATDLYSKKIEYWDKQVRIRLLGQAMTTDLGEKGSRAAVEVLDEVTAKKQIADMMLVQGSFNSLMRRMIDYNFRNPVEYPTFEYDEMMSIEDQGKLLEVYNKTKTLGFKVRKADVERATGLELEEKPESDKDVTQQYIDWFLKGNNFTDKEIESWIVKVWEAHQKKEL